MNRTWISIIPSLDEVKETVAPVAKAKPDESYKRIIITQKITNYFFGKQSMCLIYIPSYNFINL
jgi:hypothetical protein